MSSLGLKYDGRRLLVLDQARLPHEEHWVECRTPDEMVTLIRSLAIRGAPLIGVGAALALAAYAESGGSDFKSAAFRLRSARPTAVNLMMAVDRMVAAANPVLEAEAIFDEDVRLSEAMSERGAQLIQDNDGVLTHCNTGGLATAGIGTALGAICRAHESGKTLHVYVDETRPLLQGARLTAWELGRRGIPHTLITDNMAGFLMASGRVQKIFVGADRIARNGDVANKIGTYSLAVLAKHHGVPFYVVAPQTTFDPACASGRDIPIEERDPTEVRGDRSPRNVHVWNPAFDVTPRELITAIVLDDRTI
jgi:methylthioribose-1-phosphate isomerase